MMVSKHKRAHWLRPTIIDWLKGDYHKYDKIIAVRNEYYELVNAWEKLPIRTTFLTGNYDVNSLVFSKTSFTFMEKRMYNEIGEEAVLARYSKDRDDLYNAFENVNIPEIIDVVSYIKQSERKDKINEILTKQN